MKSQHKTKYCKAGSLAIKTSAQRIDEQLIYTPKFYYGSLRIINPCNGRFHFSVGFCYLLRGLMHTQKYLYGFKYTLHPTDLD